MAYCMAMAAAPSFRTLGTCRKNVTNPNAPDDSPCYQNTIQTLKLARKFARADSLAVQ